ncbi:lipase class 3 family protein [Striga asiatica]|uniref:Lipase class 3 family protein n=1 Tax=Striga asiatica TaxID=4170 RepID=A0A5A7QL92_STRAF|nr:lipase class 3 family protein [Striga asiatica]
MKKWAIQIHPPEPDIEAVKDVMLLVHRLGQQRNNMVEEEEILIVNKCPEEEMRFYHHLWDEEKVNYIAPLHPTFVGKRFPLSNATKQLRSEQQDFYAAIKVVYPLHLRKWVPNKVFS